MVGTYRFEMPWIGKTCTMTPALLYKKIPFGLSSVSSTGFHLSSSSCAWKYIEISQVQLSLQYLFSQHIYIRDVRCEIVDFCSFQFFFFVFWFRVLCYLKILAWKGEDGRFIVQQYSVGAFIGNLEKAYAFLCLMTTRSCTSHSNSESRIRQCASGLVTFAIIESYFIASWSVQVVKWLPLRYIRKRSRAHTMTSYSFQFGASLLSLSLIFHDQ